MGMNCAVPGCRSGYDKDRSITPRHVTFHQFPRDSFRLQKWLRAVQREDYEPSRHACVCSLHFRAPDYVEVSRDTNRSRGKRPLLRRYLKDTAVPSVFKSKVSVPADPLRMKGRGRPRKEVHEDASDLNELDNFNSLEELADKLILDRLPHGFVSQFTEESAVFSLIRIPKDLAAKIKRPPELAACLIIEKSLRISMWRDSVTVPSDEVSHLLSQPSVISTVSEVCDVLSFLADLVPEKLDAFDGCGESTIDSDTHILHFR